ncbi:hypothetical protein KR059_012285 [Drosophila kikkawai]|nr:hypothetical protein KR059_012285 [Drosophila kikkawai]
MIPNYIFTKSSNEFEHNVLRRNYKGQDSIPPRSSGRLMNTGQNKSKFKSVDTGLRRPAQQYKRGTRNADTATKDPFTRSVGFRLEAGKIAGNVEPQILGVFKTDSAAQTLHMQTDPSHKAQCDLQESFTDFFSIIHDNVIESVKNAVRETVAKCFEQSMTKIELLTQEIRNQEALINKVHRDLTSKMAAQSETNLNQFKFLTQMLIDNQTVHYRALNQAKQNRQRRLEERELEREQKLERERKRSVGTIKGGNCSPDLSKRCTGGDSKKAQSRVPQHKLSQQQQPLVYQMCKRNAPQMKKESISNSMPNLSGYPSKAAAGVIKRPGSRPSGNKGSDRELCIPAMTYPPCTMPRRRFYQTVQSILNQVNDTKK